MGHPIDYGWDEDMPVLVPVNTARKIEREHPLSNPRKVLEFLNQDKYWVNGQLERVRIKDMDSDYLMATMLHLLNRATAVLFAADCYAQLRFGDIALDSSSYSDRMKATALFRRLHERWMKLNGIHVPAQD